MKIGLVAREYLTEIEVRQYTPKTIRSYRNNLNLFLRFCEQETEVREVEDISLGTVKLLFLFAFFHFISFFLQPDPFSIRNAIYHQLER